MSDPLVIKPTDPILSTLNFKRYHTIVERRVVPFLPAPDEPQTMDVDTLWGAKLIVRKGDFLASEVATPNDFWPIDPVIFEESYVIIRPGYCVKKAVTLLVPLTDITGDPDCKVTVVSLEGPTTVRAGDFFLAKGVQGEIWAIPEEGIDNVMMPDDLFQTYNQNSGGTPPG
ncbi:MAG TPA: hypothetical protein VF896_00705 [Anaerolineales bacterium]